MSRKSLVAKAAVLVVYFFVYFGQVADKVSEVFGFSGNGHYVMNFIIWGLFLYFSKWKSRKLGASYETL